MLSDSDISKRQVFELLGGIPDPEIPVITIKELGILQGVDFVDGRCVVTITPTYSGCPAMKVIEDDMRVMLKQHGVTDFEIKLVYSPAWTTDWISEEAKEKLRKYGIAPPEKTSRDKGALLGKTKHPLCPQCGSGDTELISQFGSTACKALYRCLSCKEPFDYFKCI
jgi:ring-1,2-phenylacetyl-CoA epoxidase subunit PaaD